MADFLQGFFDLSQVEQQIIADTDGGNLLTLGGFPQTVGPNADSSRCQMKG
jgi:hypothetical protein